MFEARTARQNRRPPLLFRRLPSIWEVSGEDYVRIGESRKLVGVVLATVHGFIDLERGGRMRDNTEASGPKEIVELLLALIARS